MAPRWLPRQRGELAERRAERWLAGQGLRPVASNWHCRLGEIDLVMQHGDTLVFVEVRLRGRQDFGGALASVDVHKQRRLAAAARHFLACHPRWQQCGCRFDVLALETMPGGAARPVWIQNAFYGDE